MKIRCHFLGLLYANILRKARVQSKSVFICRHSGLGIKYRNIPESMHTSIRPAGSHSVYRCL